MKKMLDKVLEEQNIMEKQDVQLSFSSSFIDLEVEQGQKVQGSFRITTDEKYKPEGYIYCNDLHMQLNTTTFCGLDMEISFWFNAKGLSGGYVSEGKFFVVSNLGEYEIPYRVMVMPPLPVGSFGEVKNLFHFANLAQTDFKGAVELFYSDKFKNILIGNDSEYMTIYRGLSVNIGNEKNVDHFLEIAKKKTRCKFETDINEISIVDPTEDILKTIKIIRDGWGYIDVNVYAKGDFIDCEEITLYSDDFAGNVYEININIACDRLHIGKNEGTVVLYNFYDKVEIPVTVICQSNEKRESDSLLAYRMQVMKYYMEYRLGKKNRNEWLKDCNSIVGRMLQKNPNDVESRLYQVQLLYAEKRYDDASKILDRVSNMLDDCEPELLGYYYYLLSLGCKDEELLRGLANDAELLYVQNISSWRLAWINLHLKDDYINDDRAKWEFIKKQYDDGSNSPVLFIEALETMLQTPSVMSSIGEFEIAFMTFVIRKGALARDIRNRFVFLCEKQTTFSNDIYEILKVCYKAEEKNDTLTEICRQLMSGNKMGEEYFEWYAKAVEQELRINKLYEYYIMSINLDYEGRLPKLVLMYFAYRSNLDYERNAFLYANVLKHKQAYLDIYTDYYETIEEFAREQLFNGRVSRDLSFIYKMVLGDKLSDPEYATAYSEVLFKKRVTVSNESVRKVIVLYDHIIDERVYNTFNNEVSVNIDSNYNVIFLEDEEGNRYCDKSLYEVEAIVKDDEDAEKIVSIADLSLMQAVYLAELTGESLSITDNNENALLLLSESTDITKDFRINVLVTLAEYYYEKDEISRLDDVLAKFNPEELAGKERETCIRIFVARGMYDKAFDWVRIYGTEYIDYKILVRLCDRMLARTDYEYDCDLLKICAHIFELGKYDETILSYLAMYQMGTSKELKKLWRGADSFDINVDRLLETIIVQLMYSNEEIGEEANIYLEYVDGIHSTAIEKAYLNKLSYEYFVEDKDVNPAIFERVNYLNQMDEDITDYCYLAYLKQDANIFKKKNLSTEERAKVEVYLKRELDRHMFFPFFMEFRPIMPSLEIYSDRCFIEYKGNEQSKAILHYVIEYGDDVEEEYRKEEMPHMLGGIFVMSFILFHGEKIRYYITEEGPRQEKLTKSSSLSCEDEGISRKEQRFSYVNNIVISKEKNDDKAFLDYVEDYAKKCYMADNLFAIEAE